MSNIAQAAGRFYLAATVGLLLGFQFGCSRPGPEPEPQIPVHGQVFIVTQGGVSIRLGLVPIWVLTGSQIDSLIAIQLKTSVAGLEVRLARLRAELRDAEQRFPGFLEHGSEAHISYERERMRHLRSEIERLQRGVPVYSLESTLQQLSQGLQPVTRSDADGSFTVLLDKGEQAWIAASSQRQVLDDTERYLWIVPVPADTQKSSPVLLLSNHNMLTAEGLVLLRTAPLTDDSRR